MQPQRIEEASLNAWPALQQMLYDGWIVRFTDGYTKRANSVTPIYGGSVDLAEKVAFCETLYADRGLPSVFRLPSFATPPGLDELLATRGYRLADETLVLTCALNGGMQHLSSIGALRTLPLDQWLPLYSRMSNAALNQEQTHRALLESILGQRSQFALEVDNEFVACGLGVLEGAYFGLFDIVTDSIVRGRGYGTQLVSGMLDWAQAHGAQYAYLQVVGSNAPALQLYTKAGFSEVYRYWYRMSVDG